MCSNYQPIKRERGPWVKSHFGLDLPSEEWKSHIFYGKPGPFVFKLDGELNCELGNFGLIPSWAANTKNYSQYTYNARDENLDKLKSFKAAWRELRLGICLAEAFVEPFYAYKGAKSVWKAIERADGQPIAIATIWERFADRSTGEIRSSFSMITQNCDEHPFLNQFHAPDKEKRSIVVIENESIHKWLNANHDEARDLIRLTEPGYLRAEGVEY